MASWQSISRLLACCLTQGQAIRSPLGIYQALKAAEESGIKTHEIEEEVGNVFDVIFDALLHREGGMVEMP
ncbi:MAG: DUF768 domain-containing protein [Mesorhizobium sp.]|nr:MAG: DUF768 domain-containing protein [Mesorhizobium sp.]